MWPPSILRGTGVGSNLDPPDCRGVVSFVKGFWKESFSPTVIDSVPPSC